MVPFRDFWGASQQSYLVRSNFARRVTLEYTTHILDLTLDGVLKSSTRFFSGVDLSEWRFLQTGVRDSEDNEESWLASPLLELSPVEEGPRAEVNAITSVLFEAALSAAAEKRLSKKSDLTRSSESSGSVPFFGSELR